MTDEMQQGRRWPDSLQPAEPVVVAHQLAAFWSTLATLPDLVGREERLLAAELIHDLRGIVLDLMLALNGIRRPSTTRHLNSYLSQSQRQALERTLGAPSAASESWVAQAVALVVIYGWYAPQLVARFGLDYPRKLETETLNALRRNVYDWPSHITSNPAADPMQDGQAPILRDG